LLLDCGDPVPAKGSANSTKTTYRTVVEITCAPGYILTGTPVIECKEDETWTDYPTCDTAGKIYILFNYKSLEKNSLYCLIVSRRVCCYVLTILFC
jgi:hypothetical protein